MSGDFSRRSFQADRNYSGLQLQQGRVMLDSDWNESVEIATRRLRAETIDVVGRCGVPEETADGFLPEVAAGELFIHAGRFYLDGMLAENHGQSVLPMPLDATLDENSSNLPVAFLEQPYWPTATPPAAAGKALLYLEVWQREVTYVEEPSLVEIAVGVDASVRQQTIWQVKTLADVGNVDCHTPLENIPGWSDLLRPSAGRLTTKAVGVATDDDPCIIPPQGGYRSLENRLYRVEVHDPGDIDTATFKWSRENATVATSVRRIDGLDKLEVAKAEWDSVRSFAAPGWIEITDDHLELAGLPGELRKIKDVDLASRIILLEEPLNAGDFPVDGLGNTDPDRHTRIRRWDHFGEVRYENSNTTFDLDSAGSNGAIPLDGDGTRIILEHGVEVTFDVDAVDGQFHSGDYWVFAARSADNSVEELLQEFPLGIHRHYCRLGFVDFDGAQFDNVTDCRPKFPPLTKLHPGCCTIAVYPGEDIQAAINALPPEGGCVCLKTGVHEIESTLEIFNSNVVLHGETPMTTIRGQRATRLLRLAGMPSVGIRENRVSSLRFESPAIGDNDPGPIIEAIECRNLQIEGCYVGTPRQSLTTGILLSRCLRSNISNCEIENVVIGVRADDRSGYVGVDRCEIRTSPLNDDSDVGMAGLLFGSLVAPCSATHNAIDGFVTGIGLNEAILGGPIRSGGDGSRFEFNNITRRSRDNTVRSPKLYAIDIAGRQCAVRDNLIGFRSVGYGGIRAAAARNRVEGNTIVSFAQPQATDAPTGLLLGHESAQDLSLGAENSSARHNRFSGWMDAIWVRHSHRCVVDDNEITGDDKSPIRQAIVVEQADRASITNCQISKARTGVRLDSGIENRVIANRIVDGAEGVSAIRQSQLAIKDNALKRLSEWGCATMFTYGTTDFSKNEVVSCGHGQAIAGTAVGVFGAMVLGDWVVDGNKIVDTGVTDTATVQPAVGLLGMFVVQCRIQSNRISYNGTAASRNPGTKDRAVLLTGYFQYQVGDLDFIGWPAQILDNHFVGTGRSALVQVLGVPVSNNVRLQFERLNISNNYCSHWTADGAGAGGTVDLTSNTAIVMGNHVKAMSSIPSMDFNNTRGVCVGNVVRGAIVNFPDFPTPTSSFNLT